MKASEWSEEARYVPLPVSNIAASLPPRPRRPLRVLIAILGSILLLLSLAAFVADLSQDASSDESESKPYLLRGVAEGVSAKSNPPYLFSELSFDWTNSMLAWQRTAFHFQPENNWMNDPDGPLYHMGLYHLFYQYNPDAATWGRISWGHAVSTDMIHWEYLPLAMVPDQWYDANGVWTGSTTRLPNGEIVMLYTGDTVDSVQVQNLAYPANLSDPLLLKWVKYSGNPVMFPPKGIEKKEFRDPSTAWMLPDGKWYLTIGSRRNETGIAMLFTTTDFKSYELVDTLLHEVPGTGMWECIDFYPVAINGSNGLDNSVNGPGYKHVLKASLDDTKLDYYAIGTYDTATNKWTPDNPNADVGLGLRYDYGWYYASKTFFDQNKQRRILWGWVNETDTEVDDFKKGWASLQAIPRTILFDEKTGSNVVQWPVEEIESLRTNSTEFEDVILKPGSVVPLEIGSATQLDVFAKFVAEATNSTDESGDCGGGAAERSGSGPFGIIVLADDALSEQTPVYFRPVKSGTFFCADETRSSVANDVLKVVYGTDVPVLEDESYDMRVLVDHSIVESFVQGGRRVITSRVYPTRAIYGNARVFLFNNATSLTVKATVKVWQLNSASIGPFPFPLN